ncbi:MAG: zinc-binding dehydrogenase [Solirubrobacteraceae bacterium]
MRGPNRASLEDAAVPEPRPGEVRLRVAAVGLNRMDLFVRAGLEGPGIRPVVLPHVSGGDVVGRIDALGTGVEGWSEGERVVPYPGVSCGECRYCHAGELSKCRRYGVFGEQRWGGLADHTTVSATNLHRIPDTLDDFAAAAAPAAYTTALRMLRTAGCRLGSRVLAIGIGGGVATGALLLARAAGADVYVTSGHDWKLERALALGAVAGFNHSGGGIDEWAWRATDGAGIDVVVDSVGAATWRQSIRSLAPGGTVAVCGATSGDTPDISIRELYQRHGRIVGAPLGGRPEFDDLMELVCSGTIKPVIDRTYPLDRVEDAFARLASGEQFGKVVVDCSDPASGASRAPQARSGDESRTR